VLWRALVLVLLSNFFSNFGEPHLRFEVINVLSQIAFGYVICFLILQLTFPAQVVAGALLLLVQWGLFVAFPGPDGAFSQAGNIGQVIDRAVLGYNYSGSYVTINFLGNAVTILFGCWIGQMMAAGRSPAFTLATLGAAVSGSFLVGVALTPVDPVIKRLWTASFMFLSSGWVILGLLVCYWLIEVRGWRRWTFPFVVAGMNSIFLYGFWQLLAGWLDTGLASFTKRFAVLGPAGDIPHHVVVLAVMWGLCYWLYARRIFFKI
jgi:predicted acyltransferase